MSTNKKTVELQKKLDFANARVAEVEARVTRRDNTITELNARITRRDTTIRELQKAQGGGADAKYQLEAVKADLARTKETSLVTQGKATALMEVANTFANALRR